MPCELGESGLQIWLDLDVGARLLTQGRDVAAVQEVLFGQFAVSEGVVEDELLLLALLVETRPND